MGFPWMISDSLGSMGEAEEEDGAFLFIMSTGEVREERGRFRDLLRVRGGLTLMLRAGADTDGDIELDLDVDGGRLRGCPNAISGIIGFIGCVDKGDFACER